MLKKVLPAHDGRRLVRREGIGVAARIAQAEALEIPHLSIDMAGILRVTRGRKRVRGHGLDVTFEEGDIALFGGGGVFDVLNMPDGGEPYRAEAVFFEAAALPPLPEPDTRPVSGVVRLGTPRAGLIGSADAAGAALMDAALPRPVVLHRVRELLVWLTMDGLSLVQPKQECVSARLRALFTSDLAAEWAAADVAQRLAMSEATLRRRLAEKGETLSGVLLDLRMSAALSLLQSTEESIAQVALCVGYESPSRFAQRFRERFGFAPSQVRHRAD